MKPKTIHLVTAVAIIVLLILATTVKKKKAEAIIPLNAVVNFYENRIEIRNRDEFNYLKTDITINSYYKLTGFNLESGEDYIFWQTEFAHRNKKRMKISEKPVKLSIWCELPDGRKGFYYKELK